MLRRALAIVLLLSPAALGDRLPETGPAALGFDPARLDRVTEAVRESVAKGEVPGAVVLVGRHGRIALAATVGNRAVVPAVEPMTRDTVFDLASLTKPVATATSVVKLVEDGKLRLDDRLGTLLPEFDNNGKGDITVEQLLRHRSGFIADNPIGDYADGPEAAWKNLADLGLVHPPGAKFLYSDVNFLVLGRIVEKRSGKPLDAFAREAIFGPLGAGARYRRAGADAAKDVDAIAPTEPEGGGMVRGVVHDPRARALGGVAGHAGLFATADDLALYAQMLLNQGVAPNGTRLLKPETVRAMFDPGATPEGQRRGLGWDVGTGFSAPKGRRFGPNGAGHTGFTGTSLWIDRDTDTFVILLTSRLHPDGKGASPTRLRREVATLVAEAIVDAPAAATGTRPVLTGIDVLVKNKFAPLQGKHVGLITNHTGRTRDGRTTIDAIHEAPGVTLVALFSPEHGIRGLVDEQVGDSKDEKTGLPIYSLYGKTRKPTAETLKGVDVLVYDIQDIGTRFYTYISTLGLAMEAAKEAGIPIVVLDRPNPIGGLAVAGPVRDEGFASFIAFHDIPVQHGMTVGELARMFNVERKVGATLTVIPCEGWRRADLYDQAGLLWVNPSPNMRSPTEAILYPGVGLLESTNLATGRGTDTPFERVGAPYIDPVAWATALNGLGLPGVRFVPVRFAPTERQFKGEDCGGVYIQVVERDRLDPVDLGMGLAVTLRGLYPETWKPEGFLNMLADREAHAAVLAGKSVGEVRATWQAELARFRERRRAFLLYD
jgi:uncharacterized protein YbbC (DUF1343 family)/CubicO group peptidase (beta-lactamase class C family)